MNQGKLKVVKQEMASMNIDILGISELQCTGMGKFNSDNHFAFLFLGDSLDHCLLDWKRSIFIPIPKKGNAKGCSNYHTVAIISHSSKVMLKFSKPGFSNT